MMKDLKIVCDGKSIIEFDTIMDFTDAIESGKSFDLPDCKVKEAEFFESSLHHKKFEDIQTLYNFCKIILQ